MTDFGTIVGGNSVRFERLVPGPVERVWRYLTTRDGLGAWLFPGTIELRVGGRVELEDANAPGGKFTGTVTRCDPPRLLAYTWMEVSGSGAPSELSFELEPRGDRVLLVLTHRNMAPGFLAQTGAGWHAHVDILAALLAGKQPEPSMRAFERHLPHYVAQAGKPSAEAQKFIDRARAQQK